MLLEFFIDPESISDESGANFASRGFLRQQLFLFGRRGGNAGDWHRLLKSLPLNERAAFQEVVLSMPSFAGKPMEECGGPEDLDRTRDLDAIVVADSDLIRKWASDSSLAEDEIPVAVQGRRLELSTGGRITASAFLSERDDWKSQMLAPGMDREEIWRTRLGPVVAVVPRLTIVDQYFLSVAGDGLSNRTDRRGEGPMWVFERIKKSRSVENPIEVVVYSGSFDPLGYDDDVGEIGDRLLECADGRIGGLTIYQSVRGKFGEIVHDRYWRASASQRTMTISFGDSVDMFDRDQLARGSTFAYSCGTRVAPSVLEAEKRLERISSRWSSHGD